MTLLDERARRARARLRTGLATAAVVLLAVVIALIWAALSPSGPPDGGTAPDPAGPGGSPAANGPAPSGGWDTAAEARLAAAPMLSLPESAAQPQALATAVSPPSIALPAPTRHGGLVDEGFPPTPEGAIAQLAAIDTVALRNLDPQVYATVYRSVSLPGAADPATTQAGQVIAALNSAVDTTTTPIAARWQLTSGQVKGVTDGGRQAVVCVLGELQAAAANTVTTGAGDCQAMRFTGTDWRIAPGPAPAPAPAAWPGSADAARAGYRPVQGGRS